jgi:Domain of unknown function (DUF1906)
MKRIFFATFAVALLFVGASFAGDLTTIFDRQRKNFQSGKSSSYCYPNSAVKVVDTSKPLNQDFLDEQKGFGVEVVARFYGYTDTDRPPDGNSVGRFQTKKVIKNSEVKMLKKNGMASIAVFQYRSNEESTFANWKVRATADARRAMTLAHQLRQPKWTTIYFGADGDFVHNLKRTCRRYEEGSGNCTNEVLEYFSLLSDLVGKYYNLGVYGSGSSCKLLTEKQKVKHCWLNFSPGHAGREFGLKYSKTVLRQLSEAKAPPEQQKCGGRSIDFDQVRAKDFGQFFYK